MLQDAKRLAFKPAKSKHSFKVLKSLTKGIDRQVQSNVFYQAVSFQMMHELPGLIICQG